jgi:uncharacterized protein (TIGR02452 family)
MEPKQIKPSTVLQPYLIAIANDTLAALARGFYYVGDRRINIASAVAESMDNTYNYTGAELTVFSESARATAEAAAKISKDLGQQPVLIEVANETTNEAIYRLAADGAENVVVLNFASASKAGGGFKNGRTAQEEALARSSSLYRSLVYADEFYVGNDAQGDHFYTDDMVYSPGVLFIKDDFGNPILPVYASVVTSPAPNLYELGEENRKEAEQVLFKRMHKFLSLAATEDARTLVLGAWGCGVFRHNPDVVAWMWNYHLTTDFAGRFDRVVFAVKDAPGGPNITAFEKAFAPA